jgi:hypothetical protein
VDEQRPTAPVELSQVGAISSKLTAEGKLRGAMTWFYLVAGLSVLNSLVFMFGGSIAFVVGLAVSQIADAFATAASEDLGGSSLPLLIGFSVNLAIAVVFVAIGVLGRRRNKPAVLVGIVLYALDTLLSVILTAWLSAAFHVLAIVGMVRGLRAIDELAAIERSQPFTADIHLPAREGRREAPRTFRVLVIAISMTLVCLLLFLVIWLIAYPLIG